MGVFIMADAAAFYKILDVLLKQPLYILLLSFSAFLLTAIVKHYLCFIKKNEITYIVPFILSEILIFIYSACTKINIAENVGSILMNGIYIGALSGAIYQLYKAIKDIGLRTILGDEKSMALFQELKTKLCSSMDAVTYAKKLKKVDFNNLSEVVDVLRGSGIRNEQLINMANNLIVVSNMIDDKKNKKNKKKKNKQISINEQTKINSKKVSKKDKKALKLEKQLEKKALKMEHKQDKINAQKAQIDQKFADMFDAKK